LSEIAPEFAKDVFGLVPVTDDLLQELLSKGWDEDRLREVVSIMSSLDGEPMYSPERDSFMCVGGFEV
jgi:hypothetical protein